MLLKDLEQSLQNLIDSILIANQSALTKVVDRQPFSGIQLFAEAPGLGLRWEGAAGYTDLSRTELITAQHPMRIASNTKTFIAAAILRLWEQNQLDLDVTISQYLLSKHRDLLNNNGYLLVDITIRHLLTHTSGLFDYADCPDFAQAISEDRLHHWTRTEQLQLAMDRGKPYGKPGTIFRYSDTGYILLGEIIEQVYGRSLGIALRQLLNFDRLELASTWLEIDESNPVGLLNRVHQYVAEEDSYNTHGSFDIYGGGGLVSTVGDIARFMRALFVGQVYLQSETLQEMLTTLQVEKGGPSAYEGWEQIPGTYRLGIEAGQKGIAYSHSGFFGTYASYIPTKDLVFSFSINQHYSKYDVNTLLSGIYKLFDVVI